MDAKCEQIRKIHAIVIQTVILIFSFSANETIRLKKLVFLVPPSYGMSDVEASFILYVIHI